MQRRSIGSDGAQRLQAIPLLAGLSNGQRLGLARMIDEINAEPGEELMHEGDYGFEVVFIERGTAEVRQGGETINTVGEGASLGELAVLDTGGTRTATVVATTPLQGIVLTSHFMHHVRRQMPALADAIDVAAEERRERDRQREAARPAD